MGRTTDDNQKFKGIKQSGRSLDFTDFIDVLGEREVFMPQGVVFSARSLLMAASLELDSVAGGWRTSRTEYVDTMVVTDRSGWITAREVINQVASRLIERPVKITDKTYFMQNVVVARDLPRDQVKTDQEKVEEFFEGLNEKLTEKFKETVVDDMANIEEFVRDWKPRDTTESVSKGDPFQPNLPKADEVVRYELSRVRENADTVKGLVVTDSWSIADPTDVALIDHVAMLIAGSGCDICGEEH